MNKNTLMLMSSDAIIHALSGNGAEILVEKEAGVCAATWMVRMYEEKAGARIETRERRGVWSNKVEGMPRSLRKRLRLFQDKRGVWRSRLTVGEWQSWVRALGNVVVRFMRKALVLIIDAPAESKRFIIRACFDTGVTRLCYCLDVMSASEDDVLMFWDKCEKGPA